MKKIPAASWLRFFLGMTVLLQGSLVIVRPVAGEEGEEIFSEEERVRIRSLERKWQRREPEEQVKTEQERLKDKAWYEREERRAERERQRQKILAEKESRRQAALTQKQKQREIAEYKRKNQQAQQRLAKEKALAGRGPQAQRWAGQKELMQKIDRIYDDFIAYGKAARYAETYELYEEFKRLSGNKILSFSYRMAMLDKIQDIHERHMAAEEKMLEQQRSVHDAEKARLRKRREKQDRKKQRRQARALQRAQDILAKERESQSAPNLPFKKKVPPPKPSRTASQTAAITPRVIPEKDLSYNWTLRETRPPGAKEIPVETPPAPQEALLDDRHRLQRDMAAQLEEVYQYGVALYEDGAYELSLKMFLELNRISPDYKETERYVGFIVHNLDQKTSPDRSPDATSESAGVPRQRVIENVLDAFE